MTHVTRQKLEKFSKAEILDALAQACWPVDFERLLIQLESNQRAEAIEEHRKAMGAETAAFRAYLAWGREMNEVHGRGWALGQLTQEELRRGAALNRAWEDAKKREKQLDAKVTRLLKL
jgi:uncharacterized sporulation protein YeaH/YhbH (DUF444 family)